MHNWENELLLAGAFFFRSVCYHKLVNIKNKTIWARTISATYKQVTRIFILIFEKMDNSKKTTVKLSTFQTLNSTFISYKSELKEGVAYF